MFGFQSDTYFADTILPRAAMLTFNPKYVGNVDISNMMSILYAERFVNKKDY